MRNLVRKANGYTTILVAASFVLLTTTACGKQEQWLHCQESRGWEDHKNLNKFYLNIKRSEEKILGQYIDQRNTSPAAIKESPVTLVATTNIKRHPGQNGIVQVTYTINKENLKFRSEPGVSEKLVRAISKDKEEPEWMLNFRLRAYDVFMKKPMPQWGGDLNKIDFQHIYDYAKA